MDYFKFVQNGGLIGENEELQQTDIDKLKKMYNC